MTPARAVDVVLVCVALLTACGGRAVQAPPASAETSSTAAPHPSESPQAESPKPRARKPLTIRNACSEVVTVAFGDEPTGPSGGRRTLAPNTFIEGPRDAQGKQTVSLLDTSGEAIARVHINLAMRDVEVGRSCRTLDAH
jgi:hypothetical protein